MSIEERREKNKQQQAKYNGNRNDIPYKPSLNYDPVTGKYSAQKSDGSTVYGGKVYTGNGKIKSVDSSGNFEGDQATKQDRKRGIEGYLKGQIFNNPVEEDEKTYKKIKYVYRVTENAQQIYYVGGHQKNAERIGTIPHAVNEVNINNYGTKNYTIDFSNNSQIFSYNSRTKQFNLVSIKPVSTIDYDWYGYGFWNRIILTNRDPDIPPNVGSNQFARSDYIWNNVEHLGEVYQSFGDGFTKDYEWILPGVLVDKVRGTFDGSTSNIYRLIPRYTINKEGTKTTYFASIQDRNDIPSTVTTTTDWFGIYNPTLFESARYSKTVLGLGEFSDENNALRLEVFTNTSGIQIIGNFLYSKISLVSIAQAIATNQQYAVMEVRKYSLTSTNPPFQLLSTTQEKYYLPHVKTGFTAFTTVLGFHP